MKKVFFVIAAFFVISLAFVGSLRAQNDNSDKTRSPYFYVKSNDAKLDQLPLKETTAKVNIAGVIADVLITQVYENNGSTPLEAVYVFPGSTRAAVYGMEMKIGTRTIKAKIKERVQAQKEYTQAKAEGKRVSLLEQERPNVFQMQVANIMPGDRIEVQLKYTELLIPEEGIYEFIYPTVVGPRYTNGSNKNQNGKDEFTAMPYTKSGEPAAFKFDIDIRINAGMPIQNVSSNTHKINVQYPYFDEAKINLAASETNGSNRDLIIRYQLAGKKIQSGLLLYEGENENFFSLIVQPPERVRIDQIPPREYIFIIDISGSMRGFPLNVAKKLLRNLISNLRLTDRFNVLLFAGSSQVLFEESMAATPENVQEAITLIDNRRGGGGTELYPAMKKAMSLERCDVDVSRSLIVVTDGYVSVEAEVFDLIRKNLDNANLFAFGIGSGVNRHLIEGMAHAGQGEPLIITSLEEAPEKAEAFRNYIATPVLTQIKTAYAGFEVYDVEPPTVPDVLAERPVVIYGKWRGTPKGTITVSGYSGEGIYSTAFDVAKVQPQKNNIALKYLWAREAIKRLGDYTLYGEFRKEITALGLKYNLLTAHTSFIAVDEQNTYADGTAKTVKQVLPMPARVPNSAVGVEMEIEGVVRHAVTNDLKNIKKTVLDSTITPKRSRTTLGSYTTGDNMYVWAKSGYKLRARPSTNAKVIALIPFGEKITVLERSQMVHREKAVAYVDNSYFESIATPFFLTGNWVKIQTASGQTGYVIDEYLLSVEPEDKSNRTSTLNVKLLKKVILHEEVVEDCGMYDKEELTFGHRIKAIREYLDGCERFSYEMKNCTLNEAFVLVTSSIKDLDDYDVLDNKPGLLIIQNQQGRMISFMVEDGKVIVCVNCTC